MPTALRTLMLLLCLQAILGEGPCTQWTSCGSRVVRCETCEPGYRLLTACGEDPAVLCAPCDEGTFSVDPRAMRCQRCTQCVGAQVQLKACTRASDTQCGCKEGLTCGDAGCSFCVDLCGRGTEPHERECRPCPPGTFNDQIHQKCKPWSSRCPDSEEMVGKGDAFSDIRCNTTALHKTKSKGSDQSDRVALFALGMSVALMVFIVVVIFLILMVKMSRKKKRVTLKTTKTTIVRTPTDGPQTLIATESSFHEAEQEQGNSDSTEQLIL
ncbi:tumor necrosis factor receptor superfamily member 9a isoform X2 [Synchiropus splendidus]|uniref:tumor necrosis factor receptor superfamily member 9a isoform X2 n=1 Tax=Synchiropus splendidus TaxID=270530 RepID=UPI00237E7AC1|nr:tumor necrosis factor receptor superfamily member 9a isoform X2 [Synchiropus splendidus]XP_053705481.1 tumor necrosis factor receptor superfamily member 9a isoform X2 [Synchiropus splendidus]